MNLFLTIDLLTFKEVTKIIHKGQRIININKNHTKVCRHNNVYEDKNRNLFIENRNDHIDVLTIIPITKIKDQSCRIITLTYFNCQPRNNFLQLYTNDTMEIYVNNKSKNIQGLYELTM